MFSKRRNRRASRLAAAVLLVAVGGSEASARDRDSDIPTMPLGAAAAPPLGFLDLCDRDASECAPEDAAVPDLQAVRSAALRRFWQEAFAQRTTAPAALGEARYDWSRVFPRVVVQARPALALAVADGAAATADTPGDSDAVSAESAAGDALEIRANAMVEGEAMAAGDADINAASALADDQTIRGRQARFTLDQDGWRLVNRVNRRVNRSIRQVSDARLYGVSDYWARPTAGRPQGDCEDYVLAKRQALIDEGVPAEVLSIAIVETRWGESHAVLLVASDHGEYVLDNLSPWVSRWDRVDYAWQERQRPGQPFDWAAVAL